MSVDTICTPTVNGRVRKQRFLKGICPTSPGAGFMVRNLRMSFVASHHLTGGKLQLSQSCEHLALHLILFGACCGGVVDVPYEMFWIQKGVIRYVLQDLTNGRRRTLATAAAHSAPSSHVTKGAGPKAKKRKFLKGKS